MAALTALAGASALALGTAAMRLASPRDGFDAGTVTATATARAADRLHELPHRLVQLAAILVGASLLARTIVAGHAPWTNLGETAFTFAATVLGGYLLVARGAPIRGLAGPTALLAGLLVGYGLALPNEVQPLVPALQQPLLLTVHVGLAIASYGAGGVAFLAALSELAQRRTNDGISFLPPADVSRRAAHRAVVVAFPLLTAAIALGSVWANLAWRSYWNNDPKELAAAATWLVYAAELHLAGRRDRWGAAAPWLLVVGFAGILFTWLGAGLLFIGQHGYATG